MPVEFVQRGYYQLFKNIPAGGMQFITDTDPLPPGPPATTYFRHWDLPVWFPQKTLITRAHICYESVGYNTLQAYTQYPTATVDTFYDIKQYLYQFMQTLQWSLSRMNMETNLWVDPAGVHFFSGNPHGAEIGADYSGMTNIMHKFDASPMMSHDTGVLQYPVAFDRDAGDKMAVQFNNADALNWAAVMLTFLVPAPFQP
jgi:hypothetical protein